MSHYNTDVACARHDFANRVDILLRRRSSYDGKVFVGKPIEYVETDMACVVWNPTISLLPEEAQQLIDELWRVGVRPSSGDGSPGQLGATERHLEDMRRLVFEKREA